MWTNEERIEIISVFLIVVTISPLAVSHAVFL